MRAVRGEPQRGTRACVREREAKWWRGFHNRTPRATRAVLGGGHGGTHCNDTKRIIVVVKSRVSE